jgi:hypothetical protein
MKISLLVDPIISSRISEIKTNLYKRGFRIDNKTETDTPPHIKLAEADNPKPIEKDQVELMLKNIYEQFKSKNLVKFDLVNEPQNEHANWIALYFQDEWLKELSKSLEVILDKYHINKTLEYKEKIHSIRSQRSPLHKITIEDCIADHMNLLNKCKKEFSEEAFSKYNFLKEIQTIKPSGLFIEY